MRIRNARMRDAEAIYSLIPGGKGFSLEMINDRISEDASHIFVATDFSANILGCALSAEHVYVSGSAADDSVSEQLKAKFRTE